MSDETSGERRAPEPAGAASAAAREPVGEVLEATVAAAGAVSRALPPGEHILSGYDRMRRRILTAVEKRGGRLGSDVVRVLLLVPDIFLLLVRLALDREVPAPARAAIAGILAYFLMPVDLLPEAILGGAGYLDDVALAAALLAQAFGGELEPYARKHWSGPAELREVLRDVSEAGQRLLGDRLHGRLQRFLGDGRRKGGEEE